MVEFINYRRGEEEWGITICTHGAKTTYTAVTAASSKDFKTLKGADKYMTAHGYERVND